MTLLVELSVKDWIISGLSTAIVLIILFFIIALLVYKKKKIDSKIHKIINDNLEKAGKNNYKFSKGNYFNLFNKVKSLVLDKRYKYFYKFKKRYKAGELNEEIFNIVNNHHVKNEKEKNKK